MSHSQQLNIIGTQHHDFYQALAGLRHTQPVFYWEEHGCWIVSRHDDVTMVLNDAEHFTAEGILGLVNDNYCPEANRILAEGIDFIRTPQVNGVEGADHARLRSVMQAVLTPARFRKMEPFVRKSVNQLIDRFAATGHCDFVSEFAYPLPVRVIFDVIGFRVEEEDLDQLQQWSDDYFRMWLAPLSDEEQVRCARHVVAFQDYIRDKLSERRASPRDDLLTDFVREIDSDDSRVTEDEVVIMFPMNFIGAGHETTKSALTNAVYQLLHEPSRWQGILDDPSCIPAVVEECLRFDTSVPAWYRIVKKDVEIAGQALPKGSRVIAMLASANHDETRFDDPEGFCPARVRPGQPLGHVSFSHGRHFCMGAPLARLEMRVALEALSTRLRNLRLHPEQVIEYEPNLATRVIKSLQLEWD